MCALLVAVSFGLFLSTECSAQTVSESTLYKVAAVRDDERLSPEERLAADEILLDAVSELGDDDDVWEQLRRNRTCIAGCSPLLFISRRRYDSCVAVCNVLFPLVTEEATNQWAE